MENSLEDIKCVENVNKSTLFSLNIHLLYNIFKILSRWKHTKNTLMIIKSLLIFQMVSLKTIISTSNLIHHS